MGHGHSQHHSKPNMSIRHLGRVLREDARKVGHAVDKVYDDKNVKIATTVASMVPEVGPVIQGAHIAAEFAETGHVDQKKVINMVESSIPVVGTIGNIDQGAQMIGVPQDVRKYTTKPIEDKVDVIAARTVPNVDAIIHNPTNPKIVIGQAITKPLSAPNVVLDELSPIPIPFIPHRNAHKRKLDKLTKHTVKPPTTTTTTPITGGGKRQRMVSVGSGTCAAPVQPSQQQCKAASMDSLLRDGISKLHGITPVPVFKKNVDKQGSHNTIRHRSASEQRKINRKNIAAYQTMVPEFRAVHAAH